MDRYYTQDEVAKLLHVSVSTVKRLRKSAALETTRIGRSVRFSKRCIDQYLQQQIEVPAAEKPGARTPDTLEVRAEQLAEKVWAKMQKRIKR